ncbi:MFS transporter [Morganella psychrotolerans]|uniref:Arabinose ABC transporter permease n=1 Tax=Morganella psychrotolerans TaxID=368603 RepID=A0A1B8H7H2_9GAMM|nr:MFS transporter [Morganella psychrotolerans]OBU05019.1 arabinose ABC transporter permease [Morganella psychrotolerans]
MQNKTMLILMSLSLAVFGVITTEVAVIGLLPQLTAQLHISAPQVGFLVSIYAVVVAVTGPAITLLLGRYNRKTVLLVIMTIFAVSNTAYAITHQYNVILFFRMLPALTHAVFFAIALVVAANSVPAARSAHAVAIVFSGVAVGMVLGMPLSAFIAEIFTLSAAFWFGTLTSVVAFAGIALFVPSLPVTKPLKIRDQLIILQNKDVWLSIAAVTLIFSAMFAGFSYIADYLVTIGHFPNNITSGLLVIFGISGYVGNFIFSRCLQKNVIKTTLLYPLLFVLIYLAVWLGGSSQWLMILLVVFWGILHTSGLIVSQTWLLRDAGSAPEFANSLYIAFSNLGITLGAMAGGWVIRHYGVHAIVWAGIAFALPAFITVYLKVRRQMASPVLIYRAD